MFRARILLAVLLAAATAVGAAPAGAGPRARPLDDRFAAATPPQTPGLPDLDRLDPARYAAGSPEHVQVKSRDGLSLIWVDFVRPKVPAGVRVPTVLMASPYFNTLGRGIKGQCKVPHQSPPGGLPGSPGCGTADRARFPEWYDEYFVPRGYAYAAMDLRGTRNSSGCQTYGDRDEVFDAVDVVDWIASQPWSNGKVGMVGGSYDGTIATGAAAEQPISGKHKDALAAVIPIRAIDRWYDYHFHNGVQFSSHALTPALFTAQLATQDLQNSGTDDPLFAAHVAERRACVATFGALTDAGYAGPLQDADAPFWAERDFVKDAAKMRAAVFVMHGLFDFNVKTSNAGHLWEALPKHLPKKLWLYNGSHADPRCWDDQVCDADAGHRLVAPFADRYVEWTHRWFAQFLKRVPAGALSGPAVEVQRYDGRWEGSARYPAATRDTVLMLRQADDADPTWADGVSSAPANWTYVTKPFRAATRLSGQIGFDLGLHVQGTDTTVAVRVDHLPPDAEDGDRVDDGYYDPDFEAPFTLTYGWARAFYRSTVRPRGRSTPARGAALTPNSAVRLQFPSLYVDYVVPRGHRLRFVFSSASGGSLASFAGGTVTLDTDVSAVRLPVAPTRYR